MRWVRRGSTDEDVNDDFRFIVDDFHALLDGGLNVDVVDGASVHVDFPIVPVEGREHERDRGRGHGCVRELREFNVSLVELCVDAIVHIRG